MPADEREEVLEDREELDALSERNLGAFGVRGRSLRIDAMVRVAGLLLESTRCEEGRGHDVVLPTKR